MNEPKTGLPPIDDNNAAEYFADDAHEDGADDLVFDDAPAPQAKTTTESKAATAVDGVEDPLALLTGEGEKKGADPVVDPVDEELSKIKDPEFKSEDSKNGWASLKKLASERHNNLVALNKQIEELKSKVTSYETGDVSVATSDKIKTLETQLAEAQARATAYDYRASAEFQQKFDIPAKKLEADILTVLQEFEVDAAGVNPSEFRTMNLKQASQRIRELAGRDEALTSELMRRASELRAIHRESEAALANAGEMFKKSRDETLTRLRNTFEEVGKNYEGQFKPVVVTDKATDDEKKFAAEYNAALKNVRVQAEKFALGGASPADAAQVAFEAAQYRFMMAHGLKRVGQHFGSHVARLQSQLDDAKKRLAALGHVEHTPTKSSATVSSAPSQVLDHEEAAAQIDFGS